MDDLERAKVSRRVQRSQETKTWNKAQTLTAENMNETKIYNLQVTFETFDAKIKEARRKHFLQDRDRKGTRNRNRRGRRLPKRTNV